MSASAAHPLRSRRQSALAASLLLVLAASASAQTRRPPPAGPTPRAGSWELGGGAVYVAGFDLGDSTAELTRNTTTGPGPFDLFTTSTELRSTVGVQGRIGYYFSPRLEVEGGMRYARPVLSIRISGDAEEAPDQTAEETLSQFVFDGSVLWHFTRPQALPSRVVPFVVGGVGYIRELHADQELVETGVEYHAGAGVKVWFGNTRRRFGVRGEAGISIRDGGFDFEDQRRAVPIAAGSIIYLF